MPDPKMTHQEEIREREAVIVLYIFGAAIQRRSCGSPTPASSLPTSSWSSCRCGRSSRFRLRSRRFATLRPANNAALNYGLRLRR